MFKSCVASNPRERGFHSFSSRRRRRRCCAWWLWCRWPRVSPQTSYNISWPNQRTRLQRRCQPKSSAYIEGQRDSCWRNRKWPSDLQLGQGRRRWSPDPGKADGSADSEAVWRFHLRWRLCFWSRPSRFQRNAWPTLLPRLGRLEPWASSSCTRWDRNLWRLETPKTNAYI